MTMMMTTTSASTDDSINEPCNDSQQPVDLLTIQQEIHDTMTSLTSFFASLLPGDNTIPVPTADQS